MNLPELARWLSGFRPAPAKVCAVNERGEEHPIALKRGPNRWAHAAKLLVELRAVTVRLYSGSGALEGSCELDVDEEADGNGITATSTSGPAPTAIVTPKVTGAPMLQLTQAGNDVVGVASSVAAAVAEAVRSTVRDTSVAQAEALRSAVREVATQMANAHRHGFTELVQVVKILSDRLAAHEQSSLDDVTRRRVELEEREDELREREEEVSGTLEGVMKPLLERAGAEAGPALVKRLLGSGKKKKRDDDDDDDEEEPDDEPRAGANGAAE